MAVDGSQDMLMNAITSQPSLIHIRGKVAKILLEHAGDGNSDGGRPRVVQRDIAATVGADWGMVHMSLKSMQEEGAIKIDRHRLIINKELLQKVAGTTVLQS
jgi:DNA-binding MarR family transcriptional regulator